MAYGIVCPHCGALTAYAPVEYRKMVQWGTAGNWQAALLSSGSIYDAQSGYFFGTSRCQGCGMAFPVRGKAASSEDPDKTIIGNPPLNPLWPTRFRTVPPEIPSPVREAMEDASATLGAGSTLGSMLACRTALIRAQRHMKDELQLTEESLKALFEAGRISRFEFEASDLARRWGNYLGHENPDSNKTFTLEDAKEIYGYVESLLDTLYVKWTRLNQSKQKLTGGNGSPKR